MNNKLEKPVITGETFNQGEAPATLSNADELVSRITAITKDSCDPAALAKARPEESEKADKKTPENTLTEDPDALEAYYLDLYKRGYDAVMANIPDNPKRATSGRQENLCCLKRYVEKNILWCKVKREDGEVVPIHNTGIDPKGFIFAATKIAGDNTGDSLIRIDPDQKSIIIKTRKVSERWAGFAIILGLAELWNYDKNPGIDNTENMIQSILFELSAVLELSENTYYDKINEIISKYKITSVQKVKRLRNNMKKQWKQVIAELDAIFKNNQSLSPQEKIHRENFYFLSILYTLAGKTSDNKEIVSEFFHAYVHACGYS